jgi:lysophospholipase L1-like esterase
MRTPFRFVLFALFILGAGPVRAQSTNTAILPVPRDAKWMERHEAFLKEANETEPEVVFLGDSITDLWRSDGKEIWDTRFVPLKAANFGIDGDRTQHVLWRIQHGEFDRIKPKVLVLMIGTNNTPKGRNTTPEVIEGVTAVVNSLKSKLPKTKILLLAIFPRGQKDEPVREQLRTINSAISKLADGWQVTFLDINSKFLQPDGTISTEVMPDLLHPNKKGYQIWADAIQAPLSALLK